MPFVLGRGGTNIGTYTTNKGQHIDWQDGGEFGGDVPGCGARHVACGAPELRRQRGSSGGNTSRCDERACARRTAVTALFCQQLGELVAARSSPSGADCTGRGNCQAAAGAAPNGAARAWGAPSVLCQPLRTLSWPASRCAPRHCGSICGRGGLPSERASSAELGCCSACTGADQLRRGLRHL